MRLKLCQYRFRIILIIEAIILLCVITTYAVMKRSGVDTLDVGLRIADFRSDYASFNDGWQISPDDIEGNDSIDMIYGPFISLPKGEYTMVVGYNCDSDQTIMPYASGYENHYIKSNTVTLNHNLQSLSYTFKVTEPIKGFEIRAFYDGDGEFNINGIYLFKSLNPYKKTIFILFVIFTIVDICIIYKEFLCNNKSEMICLVLIFMFSSLPLFGKGLGYGDDLSFHLMRIEGIASELKLGHIPVRIPNLWMSGNGYPSSIFYGDILLYIPAFFRLIGFSVNVSYSIYLFLINAFTVLISYYSFKMIINDKTIAIIMTLSYSTAWCRMVMLYFGSNAGMYTAMTFLPSIALSLYMMYYDDNNSNKHASIILALSMTGIITSHILSVEIVLVSLILFCLLNLKRTLLKRTLLNIICSIAITAGLSMFFTVPFLDYYKNVDVVVTHEMELTPTAIQGSGLDLLQMFTLYESEDSFNYIPGLLLTITLLAAVILWINKKGNNKIKMMTTYSLLIVFISSSLFPWDWLSFNSSIGNKLAQIQFPSRYSVVACISLTVLLGFILKQFRDNHYFRYSIYYEIVLILAIIPPLLLLGQYRNEVPRVNLIDSADVETEQYNITEYLRVDENDEPISYTRSEILGESAEIEVITKKGYTTDLHVVTGSVPGTIKTWYTNYKGYTAFDSAGTTFDIFDDEYCKVSFIVPDHYNGTIRVSFVEPWYWRASEIVSIMTWLAILLYLFFYIKRKQTHK